MTDISELFARDPEELTRDDIRDIIAKYREAREQFILGMTQAGSPKAIKKGATKVMDLSDLDLD